MVYNPMARHHVQAIVQANLESLCLIRANAFDEVERAVFNTFTEEQRQAWVQQTYEKAVAMEHARLGRRHAASVRGSRR